MSERRWMKICDEILTSSGQLKMALQEGFGFAGSCAWAHPQDDFMESSFCRIRNIDQIKIRGCPLERLFGAGLCELTAK